MIGTVTRLTRPLAALAAGALAAAATMACGNARHAITSSIVGHGAIAEANTGFVDASVALPRPEIYEDPDLDSDVYPHEADNDNNRTFGHPAGAVDFTAATRLVERYYAALAADDGAAACRMLYSTVAESVPETYGRLAGGSAANGGNCAAVVARLFRRQHAQLSGQHATLRVAAVRVRNRTASVLLGFGSGRPRDYMELKRERGAWTVSRLLADDQPMYVE